jgi:nucleoside diphosphate kinase
VKDNFTPLPDGKRERVLMLLFKGENACEKLFSIAGHIPWFTRKESITGETIRDTYSDLVFLRNGAVKYFEPAVLTPPNADSAMEKLKMFSEFAKKQSNIAENIVKAKEGAQRTLVIIKPDNWRHPSSRPGNIIDMLSKTGLRMVGAKIYQMSVAEALEFYGPVKGVLRKKLAPVIGEKAKSILEEQLGLELSEGSIEKLTEAVGIEYADDQFAQIVEFMSGVRPEACPDSEKDGLGKVKCMVLIYEGKDAISKIRDVLGPTDPTKAPGGTVRRDFGSNVMVNTIHASDSPESVEREMGVVKINSNNFSQVIDDFLAKIKK